MKRLSRLACIGCFAVVATLAGPQLSSAAPMSAPTDIAASGIAEQVHWRGYRHCHWRGGYRRCHGGQYYGGTYWGGPGLYFGRGWGRRGWVNRGWGNRGWGNRGWGRGGFAHRGFGGRGGWGGRR